MSTNEYHHPFGVQGNNYLVTGAASGIGKATCVLLSGMGANLVLVDINEKGLQETKAACKPSDKILPLDLTKHSLLKDAITGSLEGFGKLNGFIHVAGKPYIAPLKAISAEKCAELYALNTYPAIELAKIITNRNIYSGENGSIVLISSVYGLVGSAANIGYAMSKSALHGITRSMAIELSPRRIRVNCIAPGFIKSPMAEATETMFSAEYREKIEQLHPLGLGEPEDVAAAVVFLLSDASKWITGSILSVDGGFTAQ